MSEPYTDKFGYPLSAMATARRLNSPKSRGYYRNGRWVKLPARKTPAPEVVAALKREGMAK